MSHRGCMLRVEAFELDGKKIFVRGVLQVKNRNSRVALVLCCTVIFSILLGGCGKDSSASESSKEEDTTVTVETTKLAKATIQSEYVYSGKVTPKDTADVVSTVTGTVAKVNFKTGDHVKKGDVLFTMDTVDIQNNIKIMEAQLRASEAALGSAKTGFALANGAMMQTQIQNAKSAVQQTELVYKDAQNTYTQDQQLLAAGIISKNEMDKVEMAFNNAKLAYEQAKQSCDLTVNKVPAENTKRAQDALAAAQAGKEASTAQLAGAKKRLEDAIVKSPISGVVTQSSAVQGTVLAQTGGAAFVIINAETVNISVNVSEQIINSLAPGQSISVKIAAASDTMLTGVIHTVCPAAGKAGTYEVEIEMNNADGNLKSGMFGEVHFAKQKKENVFVLQRNAVISSEEENYVFVVDGGKAKKVAVNVGIDTGSQIEITSGLTENSQVVTKGQSFLKDGSKIEVVQPKQTVPASSKEA